LDPTTYIASLVEIYNNSCYRNVQDCLLHVIVVWVFFKDVEGGRYINRANTAQILYCVLLLKQQGNEATSLCC
jgi:hypothetical protein